MRIERLRVDLAVEFRKFIVLIGSYDLEMG